MAMFNPKGRANYEPNSWGGAEGGPREAPERGFHSFRRGDDGPKLRVRRETFADHYSQARQFYISQTPVEQTHIKDAFVFELSKVETPAIRARMVSHLLNVDRDLAKEVAEGLRLEDMPAAAKPARPVIRDLPPSPALSIVQNGPASFAGRKVGALVTDGVDSGVLGALKKAVKAAGATLEIIAPQIGGVTASDGSTIIAQQKVNGGPSVLYDAVAVLTSPEGTALLLGEATAKDFASDAFAHAKFIAYSSAAIPLLQKAGLSPDGGCFELAKPADVAPFIEACVRLRFWDREAQVHAV